MQACCYTSASPRALGDRQIRFLDARPTVRTHAEQLGLTALPPSELRGLSPATLVVEATGTPGGLRSALALTAREGICTSIGGLHNNARIPTGLLYGRNATLQVGRTHARAIIPRVLELTITGRLQPQLVTTHLARIDDAPRALRDHAIGDATKTILTET